MKKFKRCIAALLTFLMAASAVPAFAFNIAEDVQGTNYEESAYVLGALGIMVGDGDTGNFRPNDSITRAEFARVSVSLLGLDEVAHASSGISKFPDVPVTHWANGYINTATSQKLVIGRDDGNFDPESKITYEEAITILVRALGYEPSALAKGGYPSGFLAVGVETGLTKNASSAYEAPVVRGIVANLANNALTINLMEQTGFGSNVSYEVVDKTILKDKLSVEKGEGQVTANGFSTLLAASGLNKDQVMINNEKFEIGNSNADTLLGLNVNYYAKIEEDDTKTIILARENKKKNETLVVDGENIEKVENGEFKYWVDKEKDTKPETVKLADTISMIYNGVGQAPDLGILTKDLSGTIKLLETTGDSKYDIIFVDEVSNIVVEDTIEGSYKIIDKYGNPTLTIDPEDDSYHFTMVDKDLNTVEIKDLKEWDVLSYTISKDKKLIRISVSREFVEGKILEMSSDKFGIDGKEYAVAKNYTLPLKLQDEGVFYLDAYGKIAAVKKQAASGSNYAYLLSAGTAGAVDTTASFKVLTKDGEVTTLTSENKIKFNGQHGFNAEDVMSHIKEGDKTIKQLIIIKTNSSGKITEIDLAEDKSKSSIFIDEYDFIKNFEGKDVVYKSNSSKLGQFNITDETIVFDIPEGSDDVDDYAVRNKSMFENDALYNVSVFDVSEDMSAKAVIVTNSDGKTNEETPLAIVSKITTARNEDGEDIEKLYAAFGGEMKTFLTDGSVSLKKEGGKLKAGDIVRLRLDAKGNIEKFDLVFDIDKKATEFTKEESEKSELVYGKVTKKFANSINVSVNDGAYRNFALGNIPVYNYENDRISIVTTADIQRFDSENPARVLIRLYDHVVQEIIIVSGK